MTEFLVPNSKTGQEHYHDPYTESGARSIVRRFRSDVVAMLDEMMANAGKFEGGKTFLAHSPLRRKPWVAGAMKTLGLVAEVPSPNGACALILTHKAIDQLAALRKY